MLGVTSDWGNGGNWEGVIGPGRGRLDISDSISQSERERVRSGIVVDMKPAIYLETTIISYLAAWPSRDLLVAAHQGLTRDWWETRRGEFRLCISQAVIEEASVGDAAAAVRREALLEGLKSLDLNDAVLKLAKLIMRDAKLPPRATVDALHVAVAAIHGVETLLTWNCRHIASVTFRPRIESVCRAAGVLPPVICTPLELMER